VAHDADDGFVAPPSAPDGFVAPANVNCGI
jgi:hypothetical protein